ncbi:MAG: alpha-glucan family phosphorylase [Verrucomicrobiota bacterium]
MPASFLPKPFAHSYAIDPQYAKSAVYFSCEFAISQSFKIYSGGLGFLAGSHMRAAADLRQNLCGIGVLWSYGYYNQSRGEDGELAIQFRKQQYAFLKDTGIRFTVPIHGHPVWVKAMFLPGEIFGTVPMFFLSTDIEENDDLSRALTHRLYDNDPLRRIAQYIILGAGGARLLEELGVDPQIWHLNEAHGLSAAFRIYEKFRSLDEVKKRFVFTTHTPEEAGNEKHDFKLLREFSFFGEVSEPEIRAITGIGGDVFNHTLAALRLSHSANGVSKLHGEVSRHMWKEFPNICEITHVTNAQNKKFWGDKELDAARLADDIEALRLRKRELKHRLFTHVASQTGKLFDPDVLTMVWARRFAGYKRPDLIARDVQLFRNLVNNTERPLQVIWAGKPYPFDYGAIDTFNHLIRLTRDLPSATVMVGYELGISRLLKDGSDIWLNNPVVTREASGTSGMTAAMNGSLNLSTYDGWVCEFARDGENSFIVPPADPALDPNERDRQDQLGIYHILNGRALPLYYEDPDAWYRMVLNSMNDVVPFFDAERMADEYYKKIYALGDVAEQFAEVVPAAATVPAAQPWTASPVSLAAQIAELIGAGKVSTDPDVLASHATDKWSASHLPDVVVFAESTADVALVLALAHSRRVAVTTRGAGIGYVGGCVPVNGGIVLSTARMNRILGIHPQDGVAIVQPGVITSALQEAAHKVGWEYPPDPASLKECSIGGNIATNAGGPRCLKYGVTRAYVLGLEVVLADGRIVRSGGRLHKNKTGFDLIGLFTGSEGMLGVITEATLRLIPRPASRGMLAAMFPDMRCAAAAVQAILNAGHLPSALEITDAFTLAAARRRLGAGVFPPGDAYLIVEIDGRPAAVLAELDELHALLASLGATAIDRAPDEASCERIWNLRREFSYALRDTGLTKLNEDIVVPRSKLVELVEFAGVLERQTGIPVACFGHAGDGNIHTNLMVGDYADPLVRARADAALDQLFAWVLANGGAITGEHGVGLAKKPWIKGALGEVAMDLHRALKRVCDPRHILNPGKFLDP